MNQPLVPKFLRQKGTLIDKSTGLTGRQLAQHVLNKNAVKFTGSDSTDFGTAYPFLYPFFPTPFLTLAQQEYGNPRMLGQNTFSGNAPDGLLMLAGETKDINIRMNRDMNFDLLEVRYTVRARNIPNGGDVYLGRNFRINPLRAMDNYNAWPANLPIPLYQGFKVALFVRSGVERSLYGGMGRIGRKATGEFQPEPIELSSIQGEDDGKGAVRCPYLIAKEAVVTVRITAPADGVAIDGHVAGHFFVDGCLFGYKVAV